MDRGAWRAAVHRVTESQTRPRDKHSHLEPLQSPLAVASVFIDVAGDTPFHTAVVYKTELSSKGQGLG